MKGKNEMDDLRIASGEIGQWQGMKVIAVRESNFTIDKAKRNTIYALTNGNSDLKMVYIQDNVAKQLGTIDRYGNVNKFETPKVYKTYSKPVAKKENKYECKTDKCVGVEYTIDMDYLEGLMKPIDDYINKMLEKSYDFSN